MTYPILTAGSLGVACAVLSVFVVMRRWAFIGEGISHSGFGGAGAAWLLALVFPSLDQPWAPYAAAAACCVLTALGIGYFSRAGRLNADAAIGIFMVATVAFGITALDVYRHVRRVEPHQWDVMLFGRFGDVSPAYALAAVCVCALVVVIVAGMGKEILAYCFDPTTAEVSGVRAGLIHYLLMSLIALTIVIGVRVVGSVLATALLVLPAVTATTLTLDLRRVFTIAVAVGLVCSVGGVLVHHAWAFLPTGPVIVLLMLFAFLAAYVARRTRTA